jgi:large subunit ribosomal protein L23
VKVTDVRTVNVAGKPRRTKSGFKNTPEWKKAIITLHPDNKIDLF